MNTIPKDPDPRILKYLQFAEYQRHDLTKAEIASRFGRASAEEVFEELKGHGFPVCEVCGVTPVVEEHCKSPAAPKRQARKEGSEAVQLPPAEQAMRLIERQLHELLLFKVRKLKRREERLEGGRFVVEREEWKYWSLDREDFSDEEEWRRFCEKNRVDPMAREVPVLETGSDKLSEVLKRQDFAEEQWLRLCEEHGVDLEVDEVPVVITPSGGTFVELEGEDFAEEEWSRFREERGGPPNAERVRFAVREGRMLEGASRVPPAPMDKLIGVYVLGGGSLEELLDALHPDPASVDWDQLRKIVSRLQKENRRLATLVRGGNLKTGRSPEEVSASEHRLAVYIKRRRIEGATDDRILRELRGETTYPPEAVSLPSGETPFSPETAFLLSEITEQELKRLGGLNLD